MNTNPLPKPKDAPKGHVVVTGFNFGCTPEDQEGTRVEPGPLTVELPANVFKDLLAVGVIVEANR